MKIKRDSTLTFPRSIIFEISLDSESDFDHRGDELSRLSNDFSRVSLGSLLLQFDRFWLEASLMLESREFILFVN